MTKRDKRPKVKFIGATPIGLWAREFFGVRLSCLRYVFLVISTAAERSGEISALLTKMFFGAYRRRADKRPRNNRKYCNLELIAQT